VLCPQCGARNELGSQYCALCRYPFTRAAARAAATTAQPRPHGRSQRRAVSGGALPPATHVYNDERPWGTARTTKRPRQHRKLIIFIYVCLIAVAVLFGVALLGALVNERLVKPYVADQIRDDLDSGIQGAVEQSIAEQPAPPTDEPVVISEAEINENISGYNLGPVDGLSVDLQPEGVEVDLEAYGLSGSYSAGLRVENGQLVLDNGSLSGPLSLVVPTGEVEQIARDALTQALTEAGYSITAIELAEDALTLTLAQ